MILKTKLLLVRMILGKKTGLIYNCKFPNEVLKFINKLKSPIIMSNCIFTDNIEHVAEEKLEESLWYSLNREYDAFGKSNGFYTLRN